MKKKKNSCYSKKAHMTSFKRYSPSCLWQSYGCPRSASLLHLPIVSLTHIQIAVYSCAMASFFKFLRWTIFSPPLSFYGQKSTWPARRKGEVEKEKKVRWSEGGGGRWKKPLSVTVWHRPFSFRRHSLPVRLFLWSACAKRSFTCSPPREGKIPSLTP